MKHAEFREFVRKMMSEEFNILCTKGEDYTRGEDNAQANFTGIGEDMVPLLKNVLSRTVLSITFEKEDGQRTVVDLDECHKLEVTYDDYELTKLATLFAWFVYFKKHLDAIIKYIVTGTVESEGLRGRLHDIANYSKLLGGLMIDYGDIHVEVEEESASTEG